MNLQQDNNQFQEKPAIEARFPGRWSLIHDLSFGCALVLILGGALAVYALGDSTSSQAGWRFLGPAIAGMIAAGILKFIFTGRALTPGEAVRDFLFTGLLATSAHHVLLWQAPQNVSGLIQLSPVSATVFYLLYHLANTYRLVNSRKHLDTIAGAAITIIPFALGLPLALPSDQLAASLGNTVTAGLLSASPAWCAGIGRGLLLFLFNVVLTQAFALITSRRPLTSVNAHLCLLLTAAAPIVAPDVADLGSGNFAAGLPGALKPVVAVLATLLSQGALWAEVFMVTGMIMDGMRGRTPAPATMKEHAVSGMKKGMVFSGILMTLLQLLHIVAGAPLVQNLYRTFPALLFAVAGVMVFPLCKAIIETFDDSQSFFQRALRTYCQPVLMARGLVVGIACAIALSVHLPALPTSQRIAFGLVAGAFVYAGVSALRDLIYGARKCGGLKSWRVYLVEGGLGAFVGGAFAFYFDSTQIPVVLDKINLYNTFGLKPVADEFYPLISKWGHIQLGTYAGGAKLLFNEALKGVIGWGVAAWLFAINRAFLTALFQRDTAPIRRMFSRQGVAELTENTIQVLRWGLWMAPIIFTFLKQMSVPTWYNQDGAVHTVFCIFNGATSDTAGFQAWSLKVFMWVLAYDFFRILIWIDHMGLRVATLVNLSFIGMDRLDERFARFIGPVAATARCIPEGVKRFTTWAPLLIPFFIPRGKNWDWAWSQSEAIQKASGGGLAGTLANLSALQMALAGGVAVLAIAFVSFGVRALRSRSVKSRQTSFRLNNHAYAVEWKSSGEITSTLAKNGYDLTRRAYDRLEPAGRALFVADVAQAGQPKSWPVIGNFPEEIASPAAVEQNESVLVLTQTINEIQTVVRITLPSDSDAVELWEIAVTNTGSRARDLKVVPYLEWVLNSPQADRDHTQYNRLFHEVNYDASLNALIAAHHDTKQIGLLAAEMPPEGFLQARVDFIGRAGSVWKPRALETLAFQKPRNTEPCPSFDAIGSLLLNVSLAPGATGKLRLLMGCAENRQQAGDLISRYLKIQTAPRALDEKSPVAHVATFGGASVPASRLVSSLAPPNFITTEKSSTHEPRIGHGEVPPGTPQPYFEFADVGNTLRVRTPFTPRPFDHTMANALGHVLCVTNRGLHTSTSLNAQQNQLTTDWADTVTNELPSEIFYLYDVDERRWLSPTYLPLRDAEAEYETDFGVDGTATFRMKRGKLSTELTTFVPPDEPAGFYLLTVRNDGDAPRKIRFAPYFRIALADHPENSGPLEIEMDVANAAIYFTNPRNTFRSGPAFVAISETPEKIETCRGRFFGQGRSVAHPVMVEQGRAGPEETEDMAVIASFLVTLEIPAGAARTISVMLGQSDTREQAAAVVQRCRTVKAAQAKLAATRAWWLDLMRTLQVETTDPAFDRHLNWLKYQALTERLWARKGFYQSSGAFGFRDQLQDAVNLIWVDPVLARRQILLHARQQFVEGDVLHWFFLQQDGGTGLGARTHASDNLLWLGWATAEYARMTGDESILDEKLPYLEAETPLPPLPEGRQGMGLFAHVSPREETLFEHVLRAIDLVLEKRLGAHGLPLIGTGDWNDGLDAIGSEGRGESVWLAFFLHYTLGNLLDVIEKRKGTACRQFYCEQLNGLKVAIEKTWRGDRYLRAIHDDGTEIGVKDSGIWEIDALTAAWAVMSDINRERGHIMFDTALRVLERDDVILLGWPALREDSRPYLGRSSHYPEGVRENGMYCHGVQWLIGAARLLTGQFATDGDLRTAQLYRDATIRLWRKIAPISHVTPDKIEIYGGQPNQQAADLLTNFEPGRMIWNGYTGAAGWMLRQSCEGVIGAVLVNNRLVLPADMALSRGDLKVIHLQRKLAGSPFRER
jgi:cyclic beta-1,2-glucan synthetase